MSSVMDRHAASSPSTDVPETSEERRERVLRQWSSAEQALWRAVDHKRPAFALVLSVCCGGRELPHGAAFDEQLTCLKRALAGLGEHGRIGEPTRPMRSEKNDSRRGTTTAKRSPSSTASAGERRAGGPGGGRHWSGVGHVRGRTAIRTSAGSQPPGVTSLAADLKPKVAKVTNRAPVLQKRRGA